MMIELFLHLCKEKSVDLEVGSKLRCSQTLSSRRVKAMCKLTHLHSCQVLPETDTGEQNLSMSSQAAVTCQACMYMGGE